MDGADVCRTSSRASRRPPDVISAVAILNPRWRRRKWRHPGPGVLFWIPIAVRGAKWRPFRFRSPSWMTSEIPLRCAVQNGGPSASGRHLGWPRKMRSSKMATGSGRAAILHRAPQWGSKKVPYTTIVSILLKPLTVILTLLVTLASFTSKLQFNIAVSLSQN